MSKPLELELRKAFIELKTKMGETSIKIRAIDKQIALMKRALNHTDIVRQEITILPPETKAYKSAGRMFLLTDLSQIKSNLDDKILAMSNRIAELQCNKEYLENSLMEIDESIKEMVQQDKEITENKST